MRPNLTGVQWAVRGVLCLGVAASVTANILHAQPDPIAQCIAAWPPLALLITVELVSRIPVDRKALAAVRILATTTIAGIAAWVSYWHMTGVVARYEVGSVPYLLPLSVDGLIIVASVSLVELAGRASQDTDISIAPRLDTVRGAEPDDRDLDHPDGPNDGDSPDELEIDHDDDTGRYEDRSDGHDGTDEVDADLAPDLVPLLAAARAARDELIGENRTVSRDALARRLRRNGHSIRNSGVSELLAALRQETRSVNGSRPTASA